MFSGNFPKIFKTVVLKENLLMDVTYFIREHLWMNALDEAFSKKILVEVNLPQSWPWKQNSNTVVAAVMVLEVVNNQKSVLQIYILKKMWLLQYLSDCVYMAYVWQKFWRKNISTWVIIWIKFTVLWLLWMLYSALASSGPQLQRQLAYKSWLAATGPDCHLSPKIGHLQKTEVTFKS